MKVSSVSSQKDSTASSYLERPRLLFVTFMFVSIMLMIGMNISVGNVVDYMKLKGFQGPPFKSDPINYVKSIPVETLKSFGSNVEIKNMRIDIKFKDWKKLTNYRNAAYSNKIIGSDEKKYINGKVSYGNEKYDVKLRLKGDYIDHLLGDKWSLRIKVNNKKYINGYKVMSLQNPQARDFQGQVIINEMLKEHNIIVPRYSFVRVIINGNNIGIMALTEHFRKELVEYSNRKESVIIKFDESHLWNSRLQDKKHEDNEYRAKIVPFQESKVINNAKLSKDYDVATGLLRGYLSGELLARDVFDVKLMGEFLAIHDLWGDTHSYIWHNLRFYYNPLTAKLEPIAFDELLYHSSNELSGEGLMNLLDDEYIRLVYINTLKKLQKKIINKTYFDKYIDIDESYESLLRSEFWLKPPPLLKNKNLSERIGLLIKKHGSVVHKKQDASLGWAVNVNDASDVVKIYPVGSKGNAELVVANKYVSEFYKYGLNILGVNDAYHGYMYLNSTIRTSEVLDTSEEMLVPFRTEDLDMYYKLANVYLVNDDAPKIEIQNYTPYTLIIKKVSVHYKKNGKKDIANIVIHKDDNIIHPLNKNTETIIKSVYLGDDISYEDVEDVDVIVSLLGSNKDYSIKAEKYRKILKKNPIPTSSIEKMLANHGFLTLDKMNNVIKINKGEWDVVQPIIVPPGYTLLSDGGVTLYFEEDSYILSHGQINFSGTSQLPIVLTSKQIDKFWQGITIYGNSEFPKSVLKNVSIHNVTSVVNDGWEINAGVFVYQVDLIMTNVDIENNNCEDALNIVKSKYTINQISIKDAVSDALDSDFSTGEVNASRFTNIGYSGGGDALDFSGSSVLLDNLIISHIGDKGISVGEYSDINAKK